MCVCAFLWGSCWESGQLADKQSCVSDNMDHDDYERLPSTGVAINMTAGASAGILEHCIMYPMDSVKVFLTAHVTNRTHTYTHLSVGDTVIHTLVHLLLAYPTHSHGAPQQHTSLTPPRFTYYSSDWWAREKSNILSRLCGGFPR